MTSTMTVRSVNDSTTWGVLPLFWVPPEQAESYWRDLIDHDLLKYRLCDTEDPSWEDVQDMIGRVGRSMFFVYDAQEGVVLAEFTLDNFTGKSAQVHFSMRPANRPQFSLHLARTVTSQVLDTWEVRDRPGEPYLHSLFGLTPVRNRAACAFVQRVGFRKMGILPGGARFMGAVDDALVTTKARDGYGR